LCATLILVCEQHARGGHDSTGF